MINKRGILTFLAGLLSLRFASAHEAYLINGTQFWSTLNKPETGINLLSAFTHLGAIKLAIIIVVCVLAVFAANVLFRRTKTGQKANKNIEKLSFLGPIFIRVAVSAALMISALSMSFLGPELSLHEMLIPQILQIVLILASAMILFGFMTEIGAAIGIAVFTIGIAVYGLYMVTYLNYLGEFAVLLLFGMRRWSIDRYIFGKLKRFKKFEKYGPVIIRICYGIGLIFAAVTVKFLHPSLTLEIVNNYNLLQFHWLFPNDALLVVLGAAIAETAIGLLILIGFETRITILVLLFYLTLSLIYFREAVWPHFILYGISLSLLVQPETFTFDNLFFGKRKKKAKKVRKNTSKSSKKL